MEWPAHPPLVRDGGVSFRACLVLFLKTVLCSQKQGE